MNSFLNWIGGKRLLRKEIVDRIPGHTCYVEVFGGAAWVLFYKDPSKIEVYNDKDSRLVSLFRCVKYHPEEMQREMSLLLSSRKNFEDFKSQEGLTDIQKSVRFLYLIKRSFAGKRETFAIARKSGGATRSWSNLLQFMEEVSERLDRVIVEGKDYADLVRSYDAEDTFFYLDPPYFGLDYYKYNFLTEDFQTLSTLLSQIKGKFLLSLGDHPLMRDIFRDFKIEDITTKYSISTKGNSRAKPRKELLIRNY